MKKVLYLAVCLVIVLLCTSALAWDCPNCDRRNIITDVCPRCGTMSDSGQSLGYDTGWRPGEHVYFGTFPQSGTGSSATPIEWIILEIDGSEALLVSQYALDRQPFHVNNAKVNWKSCSLRSWLNSTFINSAFSYIEQSAIIPTDVADIGEYDYVFIPSQAEAELLGATFQRMCPATEYAKRRGVFVNNNDLFNGKACCWWWLRPSGKASMDIPGVSSRGTMPNVRKVTNDSAGVRPAIWVDLNSGCF